jgi:hypothetical protein
LPPVACSLDQLLPKLCHAFCSLLCVSLNSSGLLPALRTSVSAKPDPETVKNNGRHNFSRVGGECGWTSFTVECVK